MKHPLTLLATLSLALPDTLHAAVPNPVPTVSANGDAATAWTWITSAATPTYNYNGSYGINNYLYNAAQIAADPAQFAGVDPMMIFGKDTAINHPSTTPCFFDDLRYGTAPEPTDPPAMNLFTGFDMPGTMCWVSVSRHLISDPHRAPQHVPPGQPLTGGIIMGLADAHVEKAKLEKLWSYTWSKAWIAPTPRPP